MPIRVAVLRETAPGERRVAMVPAVAERLVGTGAEVVIEKGAGEGSFFYDEAYGERGVQVVDKGAAVKNADVVLSVQAPATSVIDQIKEGAVAIALMSPHTHTNRVARLRDRKVTSFAMELIPRITRAQAMDALSSQASVAGYKAGLLAADMASRFFPMLTTAAGTIRPAKVLVIGAGVAGLQAIATARRLGAQVEAYDVRKAAKEQVESLGGRFLELEVDAEGEGGYARELTAEEKQQEEQMVADHVAEADAVITTAAIPGKPSPRLISADMVRRMKPGSVIIDLAAEGGGNCELTQAGKEVDEGGVTIYGPLNVASSLPVHASEMYAKNIHNLLGVMLDESGELTVDMEDEVLAGAVLTHAGEIRHEPTRELVEQGEK